MTQGPNVLLYGSCVSRDTYEFLDEGFNLVGYTARQSLISACTPPVTVPAEPGLASTFQRRMLIKDFSSSIRATLTERPKEIDLLVLDLVDERVGVVPVGSGRYLTRSQELLDSGLLKHIPEARAPVHFGSDEHFALWRPAAATLLGVLQQTGLLARTLLIEATFAARTDTGAPASRWWNKSARHWNKVYARYYKVFKDAGVRTHVIGDDAVADSQHKWGPSAYHYVDHAYLGITRSILDMVKVSSP